MEDDSFRIDLTDIDRLDPKNDRNFLNDIGKRFRKSGALWLQGVFNPELMQSLTRAFLEKYASLSEKEHPELCQDVGQGDRNLYTVVLEPPFDPQTCMDPQNFYPS